MSTQLSWPARFTRAIAGEIRRQRKARGMSAEQLAAACTEVGLSIPRGTLADLENGRRASISVAEWLAIAAALEVPPVLLLCPAGTAETAEVLPGADLPTYRAAQWVAGEAPLPRPGRADVVTTWLPASGPAAPLAAYRLNDAAGRDQLTAATRAREYQELAGTAATGPERAAYEAAAAAQLAAADKARGDGEQIRERAAGAGWVPPPPVRAHVVTAAASSSAAARRAARGRPHGRTGRGALVAGDLAELRGPTSGTVELPLWLFWSLPDRAFSLDDPGKRQRMYEIVLQHARRQEDLGAYLNRDTLVALWPRLRLPRGLRQAWEDRHPGLQTAAAA
jgi:transcriptional regulator with XRE-family HTH domain